MSSCRWHRAARSGHRSSSVLLLGLHGQDDRELLGPAHRLGRVRIARLLVLVPLPVLRVVLLDEHVEAEALRDLVELPAREPDPRRDDHDLAALADLALRGLEEAGEHLAVLTLAAAGRLAALGLTGDVGGVEDDDVELALGVARGISRVDLLDHLDTHRRQDRHVLARDGVALLLLGGLLQRLAVGDLEVRRHEPAAEHRLGGDADREAEVAAAHLQRAAVVGLGLEVLGREDTRRLVELGIDLAGDRPLAAARDDVEALEPVAEPDAAEQRAQHLRADMAAGEPAYGGQRRGLAGLQALVGVLRQAGLERLLGLALDPVLGALELALGLPDQLAEALDGAHHHEVDGLVDRRTDLVDDLVDLVADAAEAEQAGEEGDRQRQRLGEAALDLLRDDADRALRDRPDRVEDRVDEGHDLAAALDQERDDVHDHLARLDEGGRGVEEGDQPDDAGLDDLLDDERLDRAEDEVLEVADAVLDPAPQTADTLAHQRLEDIDRLLHPLHRRLADEPHHARADVLVGEAEDLRDEVDDPAQVERLRDRDPGAAERAEQPAHQALLEVRGDVADEAVEARLDAVDQLAEEADRVLDDVADDIRGLGQDRHQHVLELDDRLDHPADRVDRLVDQAAVGGLHLVDAGVERVARVYVLLGERVDELVLLGVDVRRQLVELRLELGLGVLADVLEVLRERGDVLVDLGLALGDAGAGGGELAADEVGDLADHAVHVGEVLLAAVGVELVDLAREAHQLVLQPLGGPEDAAVAVVLVGVHALGHVVLEALAGA